MVGHGVVAEGVEVLLRIQDVVDHSLDAARHQHGGPGDLFRLAVGLAAQQLLHQVAGHPVVAVQRVEAAVEGVRQAQGADEVPHRDLAVAQLAFQGAVAVDLERVEEDLAIGRLDHEVLVFAIEGLVQGGSLRILVRTDPEGIHTGVLRGGRVVQQRQGHSCFRHPSWPIVEVRPRLD